MTKNNTTTLPTTSLEETLAAIDTAALDDVTGGCAACGQTCGVGPTPTGVVGNSQRQNPFAAFSRR